MKNYLIPARAADNKDTAIFEKFIYGFNAQLNEEDIVLLSFFFDKNNLFTSSKYYTKYKLNLMRNLYILNEIKNIYSQCIAEKTEVPAILKGGAYLYKIYSDSYGCRYINDIDLLAFTPEHRNRLEKILFSCGYVKGSDYIETYEKNNIKIDLHTELLNSNRIRWRKNFFKIQNLRDEMIEKDGFLTLNNDTDFIYCLLHSAIHHGFQGFKWLVDSTLFIKKKLVYPEPIYLKTEKYHVTDQIRFCLTFADNFFSLSEEWKKTFSLPYKKKLILKMIDSKSSENMQYYINFIFSGNLEKI